MAIYIEKKLDEAPHLLKYCEFIRDLSDDHGDAAWRFFDESFRGLRETHCAPWNIPIEELRGKAIGLNIKAKLKASPQFGQNKSKMQSFRSKERICFSFNRSEAYTSSCLFKHTCAFCKFGSHNKLNCPKLQAKSGGNQPLPSNFNQQKTPYPNKSGNVGKTPQKL